MFQKVLFLVIKLVYILFSENRNSNASLI